MARCHIIDLEIVPDYPTFKTIDADTDMEGGLL